MGVETSDRGERSGEGDANIYRIAGALTITRAASTERELRAMRDPLTIDLAGVHTMDTVGAWLVHRAVRDRGAKVVGASADGEQLLEQVAAADHPTKTRPDQSNSASRA